jgi:hypothetical protein
MSTKYLNYEVISWQGLIQQLVYLLGRGYYYWCLMYLSESKRDRWHKTDQKLINKYQMDISKHQRSYRKKKGISNFYYLRWEHIAVMLHTEGTLPENYDDKFFDIRNTKLTLRIGPFSAVTISYEKDTRKKKAKKKGGKRVKGEKRKNVIVVRLEKECYRNLKAELREVAQTKNKAKMIRMFDRLNGFPSWSGIFCQKEQLAKYLVSEAKKHNVKLSLSDLRIVRKRFPVKVFKRE